MSALVFLAIPVVITAVWLTIAALRQRKPSGVKSSIDDFQREMRALAPRDEQQR
jgi:hypothetical protein